MPLSRAIDNTHSAAADFFQNLIIPEKPISILTMDVAEQVIERWLDRRMLAVTVKACGKKALQTKAAPHTRSRSTFWTDARLNFKMQRKGTAGRTHRGETSIDRGLSIANPNSQITK